MASSSAAGTQRFTSPHSSALRAGISSQRRMISRARRSPTMIGSHCVAPPAGTEPCCGPTWRMYVSSTITERSHAICSSLPPPTQTPLMRASVGLPISRSLSCASLKAPNHFQYSVGLAEVVAAPGLQVGADAERAPGAGDDDHADGVVPGRVLGRARELPQHPEVEGVEHLGPVERDRRARRRLLVDDRLEAELGRVARRRIVGLAHSTVGEVDLEGDVHAPSRPSRWP